MSKKKNIPVEIIVAFNDTKCSRCHDTKCCSYITQSIETPRTKYDFEHLLWQVSHNGVEIYRESGEGWYLMFQSRCMHIQPGGGCGIYEDRPEICRVYTDDYCEFDAPAEDGFDLYFRNYNELLKYCQKRFKRWGRPKKKKADKTKAKA
jgi:Fe-S-cluster containining protein